MPSFFSKTRQSLTPGWLAPDAYARTRKLVDRNVFTNMSRASYCRSWWSRTTRRLENRAERMLLSANSFISVFAVNLQLHNLIAVRTGCLRTNIAIGNYSGNVLGKNNGDNFGRILNFAKLDFQFLRPIISVKILRGFVGGSIYVISDRSVLPLSTLIKLMTRCD